MFSTSCMGTMYTLHSRCKWGQAQLKGVVKPGRKKLSSFSFPSKFDSGRAAAGRPFGSLSPSLSLFLSPPSSLSLPLTLSLSPTPFIFRHIWR